MDQATLLSLICHHIGPYNSSGILKYLENNEWDIEKAYYAKNLSNQYEKFKKIISDLEIQAITIADENYPEQLRSISNPPAVIFCRGNIKLLNNFENSVAIVGTRKITDYGQRTTHQISTELTRNSITIISGLAYGVDALAHKACLDTNGRTIAVLGTGIDDISPRANHKLGLEIINKDGLIISEYPPITHAESFTFPLRNRIISGLSKCLIVSEADIKSGSLITAKLALDQGKDVFAVPGSIYSQMSRGCNYLIANGAHPYLDSQDILEALGINIKSKKKNNSHQDISTANLSDIEVFIINKLKSSQNPLDVDSLLANTQYEPQDIITAITILEINGVIRNSGNGRYAI